jgi:hypothetical protein
MLGLNSPIEIKVDRLTVYCEGTMGLPRFFSDPIYLLDGNNESAVGLLWGDESNYELCTSIIISTKTIYWYRVNLGKVKIYLDGKDITPEEEILSNGKFFFDEDDRDNFLESQSDSA